MEIKTCLRCGWQWMPRQETRPAQCPRCKNVKWDEVRENKEPVVIRVP